MSVTGRGNGVFLRGVKFNAKTTTNTGSGVEGRWAVWQTPSTVTSPITWASIGGQYSAADVFKPITSGAVNVFNSTGMEDFTLSSYNWVNVGATYSNATTSQSQVSVNPANNMNAQETGVLVNTTWPALWGDSTVGALVSAYRFFGLINGVCPAVSGSNTMTFGWNCGDTNAGTSDAPSGFHGTVFYYA